MKKTTSAVVLTAMLALIPLQTAYGAETKVEPKVPELYQLNYDDIQKTLLERNSTVKTNAELIKSAENGYLALDDARSELQDSTSNLKKSIAKLKKSEELPGADIPSIEAQINALRGSAGSLEKQAENYQNQSEDTELQVGKAKVTVEMVNQQIVLGTQNLFFTNDNLTRQAQMLETNLAYQKKNLEALKLRESLGMNVDLDVKNTESQINDLTFQNDQIKRQLDTIRGQVNIFIDQDFDHELKLGSPSLVLDDNVKSLDYDHDQNTAKNKSYSIALGKKEVEAKDLALNHAESTSGLDSYAYLKAKADLDSEKIKLVDVVKKFGQGFDLAYNAVQDKTQAFNLEQAHLDNLKTKLSNAKLSNQLGLVSNLDLIGATAEYEAQVLKTQNAQEDLMKAYTAYQWLLKGVSAAQ